jgi:tripartite-type tricarboxylate transporter receptor subunit TctC
MKEKSLCNVARGLSLLFLTLIIAWPLYPTTASELKYPTKPIKLVCPYGAGGTTDIAARTLASSIQEFLGQPLVVLNVTGAGGALGFDEVRKSEPDGYKMMMAAIGANALTPAINTKLRFKYDELTFIARTQINPVVMVVSAKSPWNTFQDLAADIKKDPKKFKYATAGLGTNSHISGAFILKTLGFTGREGEPVHFDSDSEASLAVGRGDAHFFQGNLLGAMGNVKGGLVRVLAVTTPQRLQVLKDVPTFKELGFPQIDLVGWRGVCGPLNLSPSIVKIWEEAVRRTVGSASWLTPTEKLGDFPAYMTAKEFADFVHAEFKRYREVYTDLGLLIK